MCRHCGFDDILVTAKPLVVLVGPKVSLLFHTFLHRQAFDTLFKYAIFPTHPCRKQKIEIKNGNKYCHRKMGNEKIPRRKKILRFICVLREPLTTHWHGWPTSTRLLTPWFRANFCPKSPLPPAFELRRQLAPSSDPTVSSETYAERRLWHKNIALLAHVWARRKSGKNEIFFPISKKREREKYTRSGYTIRLVHMYNGKNIDSPIDRKRFAILIQT